MRQPFPAVHRRANEDAEAKAERARATRDRAGELLDQIDDILTVSRRSK